MENQLLNTVEAKTRLNEILQAVSKGAEFKIQRRGQVIAKIVPATGTEEAGDRKAVKSFMCRLRAFHQKVSQKHGKKGHTVELLREIRREAS